MLPVPFSMLSTTGGSNKSRDSIKFRSVDMKAAMVGTPATVQKFENNRAVSNSRDVYNNI